MNMLKHEDFKKLLVQNRDRRLLFQFILSSKAHWNNKNKPKNHTDITMDQFITKIICDCNNVKFYCKDDLLDPKRFAIDPKYFTDEAVELGRRILTKMYDVDDIEKLSLE